MACAVLVQLILLSVVIVPPTGWRVWRIRDQSALVRSARLSYGPEFADYVLFLRRIIPEDGLVVLPPSGVDVVFGNMGFMQYFLFPRELTNCPEAVVWEECLVNFRGGRTYLISVGGFPQSEELGLDERYIPFNGKWGVFVPADR